jgi:hypothetical protein
VCDTAVGQEITFVVAKRLRFGRIVRSGVDMHFAFFFPHTYRAYLYYQHFITN